MPPPVTNRTNIGLDTELACAHALEVASSYPEPSERAVQLWYLKETVEEELKKARDEMLQHPKMYPRNGRLITNGAVVFLGADRNSFGFAHNEQYRDLSTKLFELKREMRRRLWRKEEPGPDVARFKPRFHLYVYLKGSKNRKVASQLIKESNKEEHDLP